MRLNSTSKKAQKERETHHQEHRQKTKSNSNHNGHRIKERETTLVPQENQSNEQLMKTMKNKIITKK